MINRILIRIKVVQLLYSYLLTRSEFNISQAPDRNTRDARYAYTLYLQTLLIIARLAGFRIDDLDSIPSVDLAGKTALATTEIARALAANQDLRNAVDTRGITLADFDAIIPHLAKTLAKSPEYLDFSRKRKRDIEQEANLWCAIIEETLAKDPTFKSAARNNAEFTINGFDRGLQMVVETLRNYTDLRSTLINSRRDLCKALEKSYDLYLALLMLPAEITRLRKEQIESAREKYLPTAEDLNPNLKFIHNKFVDGLMRSPDAKDLIDNNLLSRMNEFFLVRKLLDDILASPIYAHYMESGPTTIEEDCEFWRTVMKDIIIPSDELAEVLESQSIYWNDDLYIVGQFVMKTIRRTATRPDGIVRFMPMFKDEEDEKFGDKLFVDVVENYNEYRNLILQFINTDQWDADRIVLMDIVIMATALAEILNFPLIPVAVSLNEYIEIANYYSNPRSGQFINGAMFSLLSRLKAEGKLHKEF